MAPIFFYFLRIVTEASGSKNDCALEFDGVSVTFSILGDNAHNLAVFGD